ncbi:hypothetical protein OCV51_12935 [Faecalicatena acetigenes]|jgi:hypothetical protein|uniref:Uncharacterized protein n=1 Tax=Faecalicatena acetigenes TaxID=2981790 RepID=A0ABT2TE81_9FIRM|nr:MULTISPECIES: hypothetical protein [Lachnospiraceae]MCU6748546.1 hypothetical protein [Faecalicatena acetigenes]SCI50695.1 Uncharacterised protein [uncultured Clostridium sp.]DAS83824.1 MAG TPA: hypothetical protein [Caudoviricetes sp.]
MGLFGNDIDKTAKKEEKLQKKENKLAEKQTTKRESYENAGVFVYSTLKYHLAPKDGKVHVVMINSFSKWLNQSFQCEEKYTGQIDGILSLMQDDGYEILDVKFNSIQGQGLTGQMEGFHTLVTYK